MTKDEFIKALQDCPAPGDYEMQLEMYDRWGYISSESLRLEVLDFVKEIRICPVKCSDRNQQ